MMASTTNHKYDMEDCPIGVERPHLARKITTRQPLLSHHVVLGRYNGKKTRALTPATRIYRALRKHIRRTKNLLPKEIQGIKDDIAFQLQEETGKTPPEVVFCVDILKAKTAGNHWQLISCRDYDKKEVILIPDLNDEFLKTDLDSKRHVSNPYPTPRQTGCQGAPQTHVADTSVQSFELQRAVPTGSPVPGPTRFQLKSVSAMADELEKVYVQWIREGPSLKDIKRKSQLVTAHKENLNYYTKVLQQNNPFASSTVPELQSMNEIFLLQAANAMGNSMIAWYEKHPDSCLQGEAHAWPMASSKGVTTVTGSPPVSPRVPESVFGRISSGGHGGSCLQRQEEPLDNDSARSTDIRKGNSLSNLNSMDSSIQSLLLRSVDSVASNSDSKMANAPGSVANALCRSWELLGRRQEEPLDNDSAMSPDIRKGNSLSNLKSMDSSFQSLVDLVASNSDSKMANASGSVANALFRSWELLGRYGAAQATLNNGSLISTDSRMVKPSKVNPMLMEEYYDGLRLPLIQDWLPVAKAPARSPSIGDMGVPKAPTS